MNPLFELLDNRITIRDSRGQVRVTIVPGPAGSAAILHGASGQILAMVQVDDATAEGAIFNADGVPQALVSCEHGVPHIRYCDATGRPLNADVISHPAGAWAECLLTPSSN